MSTPSPGWYDDGRGVTRWWDGTRWSDHVQPATTADGAEQLAAMAGPPTGERPPKSRWWIWLAIGGVVLIGLIVAAAVLIPLALRGATGGVSSDVSGDTADEQAAIRSMESYDQAWASVDCTLFQSVTTEAYRASLEIVDCAGFEERAAGLIATSVDYDTRITGIDTEDDGTIDVDTVETYRARLDDSGAETDDGEEFRDEYTYTLVSQDGTWLIDSAEYGE